MFICSLTDAKSENISLVLTNTIRVILNDPKGCERATARQNTMKNIFRNLIREVKIRKKEELYNTGNEY
jgi:hypothetical protein